MLSLPQEVISLAKRTGATASVRVEQANISQSGRMRSDGQHDWMSFTADQSISLNTCAFDWKAKTGPVDTVRVRDALEAGEGELSAKLFGIIPLVRVRGNEQADRGEVMRYLAELAWAPDAILRNGELSWTVRTQRELVVTAFTTHEPASVTLFLNDAGLIQRTFAPDRPRSIDKQFVATPWQGHFSDYRLHQNRWLPFRGSVGWIEDGVEVTCWEGSLVDWQLIPFAP